MFAALSKKRMLGDMPLTNGTSISIAPRSRRGNDRYFDHEKVDMQPHLLLEDLVGVCGLPPPLLFFFFYQNRPFCPLFFF